MLRILERVDLLRDDGSFLVLCHNLSSEIDEIDDMKSPTAIAEMLEEFCSGNVGVEYLLVFEICKPYFVNDRGDENLDSVFG